MLALRICLGLWIRFEVNGKLLKQGFQQWTHGAWLAFEEACSCLLCGVMMEGASGKRTSGHGIQTRSPVAWTKMGKEKQRELDGFKICFGNKLPRSCRWIGSGVGWREERKRALEGTWVSGLSAWWVAVPFPEVGKRASRRGRGGNLVWGMWV